MNLYSWAAWAAVLFFQNISFTYVSRARSSGSIKRHAKASVFSNGIWIFSQILMLGPMFDILTGKHGHVQQVAAAMLYTASCLGGSLFAHYWALRTEKGKDAVGFNKKYAQIPVEDWEYFCSFLSQLRARTDLDTTFGLPHPIVGPDIVSMAQKVQALADTTAPKEETASVGNLLESGTFRIEATFGSVWKRLFDTNFTTKEAAEQFISKRGYTGEEVSQIRVVPN